MTDDFCGPPGPDDDLSSLPPDQSIAAARNGDPAELGNLLDACQAYLRKIAEEELPRNLRGKVGASDLVQDTLFKGAICFRDFRGSTRPELAAWLRRILLNELHNLRDAFAAQKRDVANEQHAATEVADPWQISPSAEALSREEAERLDAALQRLPEEARQVILLRHRDHLTFPEIAAMIGKSEEAARKIWVRALEKLQKELGPP